MSTFSTLAQIAPTTGFQWRVRLAMQTAAWSVYSEVNTTPGHAARAAYATKVANGNYNLQEVCFLVLTNASIAAEAVVATTPDNAIPDSDIQFAVNSFWNVLAGA